MLIVRMAFNVSVCVRSPMLARLLLFYSFSTFLTRTHTHYSSQALPLPQYQNEKGKKEGGNV